MSQEPERQSSERNPLYVALLIRCWRDGKQLRFMVENVATREKYGFDDFDSMNRHLKEALKNN